jgi:SAM-dependent methyltransferase
MSVSAADSTVAELVRSFRDATQDGLDAAYHRLVGALWNDGKLTDLAPEAAPAVVAALDEVGADRQGRLAILLGLLVEAEYPRTDGDVATAVRAGLDRYLDLLRGGGDGQPLTLALLYLLAHLPDDRDRILAAVAELDLDVADRTRLERGLAELDPENPDLGRCWPAPSVWAGDEDEHGFDAAWITKLTPAQILTNWHNDTRMVWAYAGAKAYWAVGNGEPAPETARFVPAAQAVEPVPARPTAEALGRHAALLRCPTCHASLELQDSGARCTGCGTTYLSGNGILDLSAGVREGQPTDEATADLLQKLAELPTLGLYYEAVLRPAYLRLAGTNWGDAVTPADEDAYIAENLRDTEGPVLDLAAGAGRWTAVVAQTVGTERLIAQDMGLPMLNVLRGRLPEVPAVLASALNIPFEDASLGAINCWNALQAFPDDAATAIAEIGRCLRPGGIFTMMTFRWNDDPIARYFQASHYFPSRREGHLLFEREQIRQWLADAGLAIRKESSDTGTFVFVTAEKTA